MNAPDANGNFTCPWCGKLVRAVFRSAPKGKPCPKDCEACQPEGLRDTESWEIATLTARVQELEAACEWVKDERYSRLLNRAGREQSDLRHAAEARVCQLTKENKALRWQVSTNHAKNCLCYHCEDARTALSPPTPAGETTTNSRVIPDGEPDTISREPTP